MNTYYLDEAWLRFYEESDPERRLALLDGLKKEKPEDAALIRAAEAVYYCRHPKSRKNYEPSDIWLWQCVQLLYFFRKRNRIIVSTAKRIVKAFTEMGACSLSFEEEETRAAFYREARNAFARYLSTCQGDGYRKKWFGMQSLTDKERRFEVLKDAYGIGEGTETVFLDALKKNETSLGDVSTVREAVHLWALGVRDAYVASDVTASERYAEYAAKQKS